MNWYKTSQKNLILSKTSEIITEDFLREYAKKSNRLWSEIEKDYEKKLGKNHHHLRLVCIKCGNEQTCRCREPKTTEMGICDECYSKGKENIEASYQVDFLKEASFAGFLKGFLPIGVVSALLGLGLGIADLQDKNIEQAKQRIVQKAEEKGYDQKTIEMLVESIEEVSTQYASKNPETPPVQPKIETQVQSPLKPKVAPKAKIEQNKKDQFNDYFSKKLLEREGSKDKVYDDGRGFATIGIGHMMGKIERDKKGNIINIVPNERSKSIFAKVLAGEKDANGELIDFNKVLWGKQKLSKDQIKKLVVSDISTHEDLAKKLFPKLDEYPVFVKAALLNGVYRGEYKKDYKVTHAINAGNFKLAADLYLQRHDYKNAKKLGISGIIPRMNENKAAMLVYALQLGQIDKNQCNKELGALGYKLAD